MEEYTDDLFIISNVITYDKTSGVLIFHEIDIFIGENDVIPEVRRRLEEPGHRTRLISSEVLLYVLVVRVDWHCSGGRICISMWGIKKGGTVAALYHFDLAEACWTTCRSSVMINCRACSNEHMTYSFFIRDDESSIEASGLRISD